MKTRVIVTQSNEDGKRVFYEDYHGPRGRHLNCLTMNSLVGQRNMRGTKRPGQLLMKAMGKKYDPHKSRFSMSEDEQVMLDYLKGHASQAM